MMLHLCIYVGFNTRVWQCGLLYKKPFALVILIIEGIALYLLILCLDNDLSKKRLYVLASTEVIGWLVVSLVIKAVSHDALFNPNLYEPIKHSV